MNVIVYEKNTCATCTKHQTNGGYCYILHFNHFEALVSPECKQNYEMTPWFQQLLSAKERIDELEKRMDAAIVKIKVIT